MSNEQKYSVMTVKDMLWKILRAWKLIATFAVIGLIVGVLYSGRAYNSKMVSYNAYCENLGYSLDEEATALKGTDEEQRAYAEQRAENWKKQLTVSQISAINDCMSIKKLMSETENYINNSVYMQVDPYNIDLLTLTYQIDSATDGLAAKVAQYYNTFISGGAFIDGVADGLGWKGTDVIYSDLVTSQVINGTQVKLTFFCADADNLTKAEGVIKDIIQKQSKEFVKQYGTHALTIIEASKIKGSDINIANNQNIIQSRQQTYNTQVVNFGNTFKIAVPQINYYNYLTNVADGGTGLVKAVTDDKAEIVAKPSSNKLLFVVAGAFAGIVVAIIIILCGLLAGGRLLKSEELVTIFELPYLGALVNSGNAFIIDKMIKKAEYKSDGPYDSEVRCSLAAERIAGAAKAKGIDEIAIIGTEMGKGSKKSATDLADKLKELGVEVKTVGNIMTESEVTSQTMKVEGVFVLEVLGKSTYKAIEKEISMLKGCGVQILGAGCIE